MQGHTRRIQAKRRGNAAAKKINFFGHRSRTSATRTFFEQARSRPTEQAFGLIRTPCIIHNLQLQYLLRTHTNDVYGYAVIKHHDTWRRQYDGFYVFDGRCNGAIEHKRFYFFTKVSIFSNMPLCFDRNWCFLKTLFDIILAVYIPTLHYRHPIFFFNFFTKKSAFCITLRGSDKKV